MDNPWGSPWAEAASRTSSSYRPPAADTNQFTSLAKSHVDGVCGTDETRNQDHDVSGPEFPTTPVMDMSGASAWSTSNDDVNLQRNDNNDAFGDWASPSPHDTSVESLVSAEAAAVNSSFAVPFETPSIIAPDAPLRNVSSSFGGKLLPDAIPSVAQYSESHAVYNTNLPTSCGQTDDKSLLTQLTQSVENSLIISTLDPWAGETAPAYNHHDEDEARPRLSEDKSSLASTGGENIESPATSMESLDTKPIPPTQPTESEKHDLHPETEFLRINTSEFTVYINSKAHIKTTQAVPENPIDIASAALASNSSTPDITIDAPTKFSDLPQKPDGDEPLKLRKTRSSTPSSDASSSRVQSLVDMYDGIARSASSKSFRPVSQSGKSASSRASSSSDRTTESVLEVSNDTKSETPTQEETEKNDVSTDNPNETDKHAPITSPEQTTPDTVDIAFNERPQTPKQDVLNVAQHAVSPRNVQLPDSPMSTITASPAKINYKTSVPRDVNMGDISRLYDGLCEPPTSEGEVLPETIYDCFVTQEERNFWLRVSRPGSVRRHKFNDDQNYKPVGWPGSMMQKETVKIVRRWMEEGSSVGRVMSSVGGGTNSVMKAATKMFSWNDTSASDPVDLSALTERLQMNKAIKEQKRPRPISVRGSRGFHAPSGSIGSIASVASTSVNEKADPIRAGSLDDSPKASPSAPSGPVAFSLPRASLDAPHSKKSSVSSLSTRLVSMSASPIASPVASPISISAPVASNVEPAANDDDDEWGEMVSSPVVTRTPGISSSPVVKMTSPCGSDNIKKQHDDHYGGWGDMVSPPCPETKTISSPVLDQNQQEDDDDEWGEMVTSPVVTQAPSCPSYSARQSLDSPSFALPSRINLPPIPPTFPILHTPTHSINGSVTSSPRTPNFPLSPVGSSFGPPRSATSRTHSPSSSLSLHLPAGNYGPTKPYTPSPLSTAPVTLPSPDYIMAQMLGSVKLQYASGKLSPTQKSAVPLPEFLFPMSPPISDQAVEPEKDVMSQDVEKKDEEEEKEEEEFTLEDRRAAEEILSGLPDFSYMSGLK